MNDSPPHERESLSTTIKSVRTVLGFFTLIVLVSSGVLGMLIVRNPENPVPVYVMIAMWFGLAVMVVVVAVRWPPAIGLPPHSAQAPPRPLLEESTTTMELARFQVMGFQAPF